MQARFFLIFLFLATFLNIAQSKPKMKRFENPAIQFIGSWHVDAYDFREFLEVPTDLEKQIKEYPASFPIGQILKIDWHGAVVMPGTINPQTGRSEGPVGEELSISFIPPLEKNLCAGYWDFVCKEGANGYVRSFMITEIYKWDAKDIRIANMWPEVKHVSYVLVALSKSHSFETWVTNKGQVVLPITLAGKTKNGKPFGVMGVILKRVDHRHDSGK
ncbi:MAG TPA: hypothetical protein VF800_12325 [Telluria sp.]|jgi:hypothetical protein